MDVGSYFMVFDEVQYVFSCFQEVLGLHSKNFSVEKDESRTTIA